jgi:prevent-host-death family protein
MDRNEDLVVDGRPLPRMPASDIKRRGWPGVMRAIGTQGTLVVTNHGRPEAVIVGTAEYARLRAASQQAEARLEADLSALRRRFDERLAGLRSPNAGQQLRQVMAGRARLDGKVKAGSTY